MKRPSCTVSTHPIDWKPAVGRLHDCPDGEHSRRERDMIRHIGIWPIIIFRQLLYRGRPRVVDFFQPEPLN